MVNKTVLTLNYIVGTRVQERFKKQMNSKMSLMKAKWTGYTIRAEEYNATYLPEIEIDTPTFDEVKELGMDQPFCMIGSLDHPKEPWANQLNTKKGIEAYLVIEHCHDELKRISREARQAVKWAIQQMPKLLMLSDDSQIGISSNDFTYA